jgi:CRP/FNR family transcriptional regulator
MPLSANPIARPIAALVEPADRPAVDAAVDGANDGAADCAVDAAIEPAARAVSCSDCTLRTICLPEGLTRAEFKRVDAALVAQRRRVARNEVLFRRGEPFDAVFAVWSGFFKTRVQQPGRREQVTGFQMGGELIALDAIGSGHFQTDAVALEASQVCVIPFDTLLALSHEVPTLQRQFHRLMSREIARRQGAMLLLGGTPTDERVAAFLVDLTQRLSARGFSASALVLRMTRREIGSLLGLTLETVSRSLSRLQAAGLLFVRTRHIQIVDAAGLRRMLEPVEG